MNRSFVSARIKEPSTWAAFAILSSFFGPQFADPGIQQSIVTVGVSLSGILAAILGEKH